MFCISTKTIVWLSAPNTWVKDDYHLYWRQEIRWKHKCQLSIYPFRASGTGCVPDVDSTCWSHSPVEVSPVVISCFLDPRSVQKRTHNCSLTSLAEKKKIHTDTNSSVLPSIASTAEPDKHLITFQHFWTISSSIVLPILYNWPR